MPKITEPTLTTTEAARMIGCTRRHLRTMIQRGRLKVIQQSRSDGYGFTYLVPIDEAQRWRDRVGLDRRGRPRGTKSTDENLKDWYVYGWYTTPTSRLPFYVGYGVAGRCRAIHWSNGSMDSCEKIRRSSTGFTVKIYRQDLTEQQAAMLENVVIRAFFEMGGCECNKFKGSKFKVLKQKETPLRKGS